LGLFILSQRCAGWLGKGIALLKNWKTTLAGLAAGGLNMFANGTNWKQILVSLGFGALGLFAKDHNVTGGDTPQ
jgi:hypothetical protein